MTKSHVRSVVLALGVLMILTPQAYSQQLAITNVSVSRLGNPNLCVALGGQGVAPTITIRHSKTAGTISLSMIDQLSNGGTVNHGSTSVAANPSGTTVVTHNFLPPCNRRTGEGLKSAYSVTASAGGSSKTVLWGRYP